MQHPTHINDSDKVIEALGYWPTFHDAEIVSFSAERAIPTGTGETVARFAVNVRQYEPTGEGTAQYELILRKNVLISFICHGAGAFELSDWNHQNVIDSITVSEVELEGPGIHVEMRVSGILCKRGFSSAAPFDPRTGW